MDEGWEGCLSVPDMRGVVPRYTAVRLEYLDREGSRQIVDAKDAPGRAPRKPVAGPPKKTKPSPNLERATRPEPDSPVLNLLWLLTASRRH